MRWKDSDGKIYNISRELARSIDQDQGREHMPRAAIEGVTDMAAAVSVLKSNAEQMEKWLRKTGAWAIYKQAIGMVHKSMQLAVNHALVEQACALQGMTTNVWVNVDTSAELGQHSVMVTHHRGEEYLRVKQADLQLLMCAARGGLRDEHGSPANCHNCPHCFERSVWQTCELYHLINSIPCNTLEQEQLFDTVCPYALDTDEKTKAQIVPDELALEDL